MKPGAERSQIDQVIAQIEGLGMRSHIVEAPS